MSREQGWEDFVLGLSSRDLESWADRFCWPPSMLSRRAPSYTQHPHRLLAIVVGAPFFGFVTVRMADEDEREGGFYEVAVETTHDGERFDGRALGGSFGVALCRAFLLMHEPPAEWQPVAEGAA